MNAATMSFMQHDADTVEVKAETIDAPVQQSTEPLKRRVRATGQRHGKAFGNIGVVTTSYTKGFAEGFMSAFRD